MFKIFDGRSEFYQWDLNQKLIVSDADVNEVHFCNRTDDCSLVCSVYLDADGVRLVDVPNILFQDAWRIRAYAFAADHTKAAVMFNVVPRTKPSDYVYTETEVKRYEDFEERLKALERGEFGTVSISDFAVFQLPDDELHIFATGTYEEDNETLIFAGAIDREVALENIKAPTKDNQAANKKYVDDAIASIPATEADNTRLPTILAFGDSLCAGDRNNGKGFVGELGFPYVNRGKNVATLGCNHVEFGGVVHELKEDWIIRNQLAKAVEDGIKADIIIADGGVNDYAQGNELGTLPAQMATTDDYFTEAMLKTALGGLEKLFYDMWKHYGKARKLFVLPHKMTKANVNGVVSDWTTTKNTIRTTGEEGYTMAELFDAIRAVCFIYKVELVDVYKDCEIDTNDEKYISKYAWADRNTIPNYYVETAKDWIDADGAHPNAYGYTMGYVPIIHRALFNDNESVEASEATGGNVFYVPIIYDGTKYTLDGIGFSECEAAYNEGKHLIVKVNYDGAYYYADLLQRIAMANGCNKYDFSNGTGSNPQGKGTYSIMYITFTGAAIVSFSPTPETSASKVSCDVEINGTQQTNVADALNALAIIDRGENKLPDGSEKQWRKLAEFTLEEDLTEDTWFSVETDSEGNELDLVKSLFVINPLTDGTTINLYYQAYKYNNANINYVASNVRLANNGMITITCEAEGWLEYEHTRGTRKRPLYLKGFVNNSGYIYFRKLDEYNQSINAIAGANFLLKAGVLAGTKYELWGVDR